MRTIVIDDNTLEIIIDKHEEVDVSNFNIIHSEKLKGFYAKYWVNRN